MKTDKGDKLLKKLTRDTLPVELCLFSGLCTEYVSWPFENLPFCPDRS